MKQIQLIQENPIEQQLSTNKSLNILLVTVQGNTDIIGLKYLHAYLRKNNISSRILILPDYNETMNCAVEKFFNQYKPQLVGFSVLSTEFFEIEKLATFLKSKYKFISFMGGYHATIDPQQCLKYVDFIVRGEAEDVLLEICNVLKSGGDISKISNLAFMDNGFYVQNPMRSPETNLDKYPFHENLPPETYIFNSGEIKIMNQELFKKYSRYDGKYYSLTTSRGCNLKCGFCIHSFLVKLRKEENMKGPLIRIRSVDNCIEELKIMKQHYPDTIYINIADDNFLGHEIEWLKEFRDKIKKEINIPISARAIPTFLTEEKAKILKDAGLTWVMMGLQTGSQRVQREIYQRMISNEQFLQATKIINDLKLVPFYDVILDSPFETEEDILETIKVLTKIPKPYQLQLFSLAFFPGTRIYDLAKEQNMDVDPYKKHDLMFNKSLFLNKVIRLIPLIPPSIIYYLTNNRNKRFTKIIFPFVYYPSIFVLEPIVWLKLIKLSLGGSMIRTFNMLRSFARTGFKNRILRKV